VEQVDKFMGGRMPRIGLTLTCLLGLCALPPTAQPYDHQEAPTSVGLWPNSAPVFADSSPVHTGPARTISVELLRYPLSSKASRMLHTALQTAGAGDHAGAVKQLQKTLAKYPGSAPYVYSLLGVEYLRMEQGSAAVEVLKQAVKLLPHDASNHANLGLALVSKGEYDCAEPELRRALDLDSHYALAKQVLSVVALNKSKQK
jgi:tetratricopeptide (TPR) repeat protein